MVLRQECKSAKGGKNVAKTVKQQLSDKQKLQKLTQARARAQRTGQATPRLDEKIERLRAQMASVAKRVPAAKPSPSKYYLFRGVNKKPIQGGICTPK